MKDRVMIDLELMALPEYLPPGKRPEVVEIAAVRFNQTGVVDEQRWFPRTGNGMADPFTWDWWNRQLVERLQGDAFTLPDWMAARAACDTQPMPMCLEELYDWMRPDYRREVWCWSRHGRQMDLDVLRMHYAAHGKPRPWAEEYQRDVKNLVWALAENTGPHGRKTHDALDDAIAQVEDLLHLERKLEGAA